MQSTQAQIRGSGQAGAQKDLSSQRGSIQSPNLGSVFSSSLPGNTEASASPMTSDGIHAWGETPKKVKLKRNDFVS